MTDKLIGVHPVLAQKIRVVLDKMAASGFPMMVTDGVRTTAQQALLYAQGRTAPGHIVTNCDGIHKRSNHQPHADGLGHAVDCCFVVDGHPSWDARLPWKAYGKALQDEGIVWGGSWTSLHDLPHAELKEVTI